MADSGLGETNSDAARRVSSRSEPQQERSRLRRTMLVDAAEAIVTETGMDGLRMREVARRAGLPIASVYHYFPSTAAIIRALSVRNFDRLRSLLVERLGTRLPSGLPIEGRADLVSCIIDDIAGFVFQTPSVTAIWSGLHSHPDLRALDIADTLENGRLLQPYLTRLLTGLSARQAEMTALVLIQAVSGTLMLAVDLPAHERDDLVAALKHVYRGVHEGPFIDCPRRVPAVRTEDSLLQQEQRGSDVCRRCIRLDTCKPPARGPAPGFLLIFHL